MRLRGLRARAAALLLACGMRVATACNVNQVETRRTIQFFRSKEQACTNCGVRQYGSDGVCYDCLFFARQRKYKDVYGTLWCTNSCDQMDRTVEKDVDFSGITGGANGELAVLCFEYTSELPATCRYQVIHRVCSHKKTGSLQSVLGTHVRAAGQGVATIIRQT